MFYLRNSLNGYLFFIAVIWLVGNSTCADVFHDWSKIFKLVFVSFCLWQLLVFMVLLPGVSCSPMPRCHPTNLIEYRMTIESMTRQHKAKRFLLMTENLSGEFNLSFTGGDRAPGTGEITNTYSRLTIHKGVMLWFENLKNFIQNFSSEQTFKFLLNKCHIVSALFFLSSSLPFNV